MSLLETFCPGLSSIPKHLPEGDEAKMKEDHQTVRYRSTDICKHQQTLLWSKRSLCALGALVKKPLTVSVVPQTEFNDSFLTLQGC